MSKLIDLTGQKFGRLTVIKRGEMARHGEEAKWICRCDCGNIVEVKSRSLRSGNTRSCGCLKLESLSNRKGQIKGNDYEIVEDYVIMKASNTGSAFYFDLDDLDRVKKYTWVENKRGYICMTNSRVRLHQFIKGEAPEGMVIDHKDRNKLNNRKSNLEFKTQADNAKNRTVNKNNKFGISGVHKTNRVELPYQATLGARGRLFKNNYATLEEAIRARLMAEKKFWGDKAPQKHLFKEYGIE